MTTETRDPAAPTSAQGPEAAQRALQTAQQAAAIPITGDITVRGTAGRDDQTLERVEATITIPADFQYRIPIKGVKNPDGSWNNDAAKVGLTVDAYDYINRIVGCSFFFPEKVHDERGVLQYNPIHRSDYIYLRMGAVWYSPLGQLLMSVEDVEVDFARLYQEKRANADGAKVRMGTDGPLWDEAGNIILELAPTEELKAYKELTRNRSFGPRYAITVGRVRLLKMATGMRSLPINHPTGYPLKVVGYRDKMTPQQRIESAGGGSVDSLYGRPPDIKPLTAAEATEAGLHDELDSEEEAERRMVAAAADEARRQDDPPPAAEPVTTGEPVAAWDPSDLPDEVGPIRE